MFIFRIVQLLQLFGWRGRETLRFSSRGNKCDRSLRLYFRGGGGGGDATDTHVLNTHVVERPRLIDVVPPHYNRSQNQSRSFFSLS